MDLVNTLLLLLLFGFCVVLDLFVEHNIITKIDRNVATTHKMLWGVCMVPPFSHRVAHFWIHLL